MTRICAWCKQPLAPSESGHSPQSPITHGICLQCSEKLTGETKHQLPEFLDTFSEPILLVGPDGAIGAANKSAQEMLGKPLANITGYPGGEVFECVNASLPEGCGNTIHCLGCTVRNAVMHTLETGQKNEHVPATLDTHKGSISFRISTERMRGVVLLRVEKATAVLRVNGGNSLPHSIRTPHRTGDEAP